MVEAAPPDATSADPPVVIPAVDVSAKLQLVYLRSGRVLAPLGQSLPEAHERRSSAGERGLRRLADDLAPGVVAGLESLLDDGR